MSDTLTLTARCSAGLAVAVAAVFLLTACVAPEPTSSRDDSSESEEADDESSDIDEAAALVTERYELVRGGDYAAACELYSEAYAELFIELAGAEGSTCEEAHEAAAANADEYQQTAEEQGRAGLIPFFFVPSEIEVDTDAIKNDEPGLAFLGQGTVVSLDETEFEDGVGVTPGWLRSQDYVQRGDDGVWRFISAVEQ